MPPPPNPRASNNPIPVLPLQAIVNMDQAPRERGASSIPCPDYDSSKHDFDTWIEKFENAVNVATNATTQARKHELYFMWLPLKLDDEARAILKQVPGDRNYVETVAQLKELLTNEVEIYKWKSMQSQIIWDGKESFQALATRVKNAVDRFEKELSAQGKIWAYFFRFRAALPPVYQDYIDVSIAKDDKTIDNAKELALRVQMTQRNKETDKQVTFTGAAMADDRIHALELEMAKLSTQVKDRESRSERRDSRPYGDWNNRSPSRGQREYSRERDRYRFPSRDRYGNRVNYGSQYGSSSNRDRRDDRSRRGPSYDRGASPRQGQYPNQGNRPQNYRPRSPRSNYPQQPTSGRDNRDNRERNNGGQRQRSPSPGQAGNRNQNWGGARPKEQYRAIDTADEFSDLSDLDDDALNAYIESLVTVKNKRQARRERDDNPEN